VENIDCLVIGAGVVGLATARALAQAGREVVIVDAAERIGSETSSRNSEVIHAGLYYPTGSLMARSCVEGRRRLYYYCAERGIGHNKCGKLIVASDSSEEEVLDDIMSRAAANGAGALKLLTRSEALALEPALDCTAALLSPETGIIDSHRYMMSLQADAEAAGAVLVLTTKVIGGSVGQDRCTVQIDDHDNSVFACRSLVNAAGLHAPALATRLGLDARYVPPRFFAKGHYFALHARNPFSRLIYPVPVPGGLGIHLTFDLAGRARFGPDVAWIDEIDYSFEAAASVDDFEAAIRRYFPGVPKGSLVPDYCGIRPKLSPASGPRQDFVVQGPEEHGIPGLLNFFGIESPGLTASLALADYAVEKLVRAA
jgi:L-2-hydroxyglutarate oxidase LhgO